MGCIYPTEGLDANDDRLASGFSSMYIGVSRKRDVAFSRTKFEGSEHTWVVLALPSFQVIHTNLNSSL